ncbi:hypothetical protein B0H10DRAFT_2197908 [Mycena sp. CBHHK59/15]|nr:hypothetical protein B0H10DRAFT_2197908 [Mycena sp. CBHHK59/15]
MCYTNIYTKRTSFLFDVAAPPTAPNVKGTAIRMVLVSIVMQTLTVNVGAQPTSPGGRYQFNPNIVTAPKGTVVSFVFSGIPGNHSVTQSSFATPCQLLPRGFDSSFIAGREIQGGRFPMWTLTVTNDQNSMWFYCKQVIPSPSEFPTSHCNAGMVGVINVQAARNSFSDFQAKAEQSSTGTATAPSGCLQSPGSSSIASFSALASSHSKIVPVAAIVGAIIGAIVLLTSLCMMGLLIRRRRTHRRREWEEKLRPNPLILYERPVHPENTLPIFSTLVREIRALRRQISSQRPDRDPPGRSDMPPEYSAS